MQLLPQPRHHFSLIFTMLGFILLPSASFCAILLANIHLGCTCQGRAAPWCAQWSPLFPMAAAPDPSCQLRSGSQRLQKQTPFSAGFIYCSELEHRICLSPLQRGSSRTRGLPSTGRGGQHQQSPPRARAPRTLPPGICNLACMNCLATATRLSSCQPHLQIT